jgi:hypothetical protein
MLRNARNGLSSFISISFEIVSLPSLKQKPVSTPLAEFWILMQTSTADARCQAAVWCDFPNVRLFSDFHRLFDEETDGIG